MGGSLPNNGEFLGLLVKYQAINTMLTTNQFWKYLFSIIPLRRLKGETVELLLTRVYEDYLLKLKSIREKDRSKINDWDKFCSEQNQICDIIVSAVSFMSKGMHSKAYSCLSPVISNLSNRDTLYYMGSNVTSGPSNTKLFRMRMFPDYERKFAKAEDMFHIPFNKRDIIRTQRFSSPGYPCLYLGTSIYGCWEEMGRPLFDLCMTSRFDLRKEELRLYNLCFPEMRDLIIDESLYTIPLVLACMIEVANKDAVFKPEYIIPQLVTEWVISTRDSECNEGAIKSYDGIMYSSIHSGHAFNFPLDKLVNMCVPAFDSDSNTFCKTLSETFHVTEPTCYEYEVLKQNVTIREETVEKIKDIEKVIAGILIDNRIEESEKSGIINWLNREINYYKSRFNFVEDALSDKSCFPARNINF